MISKSAIKLILNSVSVTFFLVVSVNLNAQADKKYIRKGNKEYDKNKFAESEISYKKALDKNKMASDAIFNTGDALYKQKKYEEASKQFAENINQCSDKGKKAAGFYNMGNSLLKANKLQESIDAYKNSLKLHPDNKEAKYNLAYAQDLLKMQQDQQNKKQQQQDNKDKKDQNKDKDKNKDQNKNQNQDQNKDQNKQNHDQQKDQQQKQQNSDKQQISKEDAERLLNALANDEKNVQQKVKEVKAAKAKVKTLKNW